MDVLDTERRVQNVCLHMQNAHIEMTCTESQKSKKI